MRRATIALAITLAFAPAAYVRILPPRNGGKIINVIGSRDRHLRGKHRIRARRAA